MTDAKIEFINVTSLRAEAIGEPGQRTFRILVGGGDGSAVIWLEKEQLFHLALGIEQLMETLPEVHDAPGVEVEQDPESAAVSVEFRVAKMSLGYEGANGRFVIDAHDVESGEDDPPTVRIWSDRSQVEVFSEEALLVCAAGRPICPLCDRPIDRSGHRCPRTNGHGLVDLPGLEG